MRGKSCESTVEARSKRNLRTCAFFAGGSGGHITPAVAVAEALRKRDPSMQVVVFTGRRRAENAVSLPRGVRRCTLPLVSPGRGPFRFSTGFLAALFRLRRFLQVHRGTVCFALGSYASLPGGLAAYLSGSPLYLLEQNRVVGRANRLLSPFARCLFTAFPDTCGVAPFKAVRFTGNPVRGAFTALSVGGSLRTPSHQKTIAVLGGSQGAAALNRAVVRSLPQLARLRLPVRFVHAAGPQWRQVAQAYRRWGIPGEVAPFFPDLAVRIAGADSAFSRAGGSTIAELLVLGIPAVYVPYRSSAGGHQESNARYVEEHGGGVVCPEERFDGSAAVAFLKELFSEIDLWRKRAQQASALARRDAADCVATEVCQQVFPYLTANRLGGVPWPTS